MTDRPLDRRSFLAAAAAAVVAACSSDDDGAAPTTDPTAGSSPDPTGVASSTTAPGASTAPPPSTTEPVEPLDAPPDPGLAGFPFTLGVASGDPLPDAVVLWTRVAPDPVAPDGGAPDVDVDLVWELADGEGFARLVATGLVTTTPADAHSVHLDVTGLTASTTYWYRFRVGDHVSPVGRTRTAPAADSSPQRVRFATANCAAYNSGYYAAYRHLADEPDLDAVFFVGDYIYELEPGSVREHGRPFLPATLDEFRAFYGAHKSDADLAAAHAAHPWIVTWDDHEVEDNYAALEPGGIGRQLDENAEAAFPAKRAAAYRAWWEHMPVRVPRPVDGDALVVHRSFRWGDVATTAVVDNRQYRDPPPDPTGAGALPRPLGGGPQVAEAFDESRSMLGADQEAWLTDVLTGADTRWTVLVQQTVMAEIDRRPDLDDAGSSMDGWDGYVANRNRILGLGVADLVVLGGDIHTAAVTDLYADFSDTAGPVVATEFVAPSISSLELITPEALAGARSHEYVKLYDPEHRGYLVTDFGRDEATATFRFVTTTAEPTAEVYDAGTWRVVAGRPGAEQVS